MIITLCCFFYQSNVYASGITTYGSLVSANYWILQNKDGDKVILDANGVKKFNTQICNASRSVYDLTTYPTTVSGDSLKTKIMNYAILDDDLYLHGSRVSENYKNILRQQTNVKNIPANVAVRYAVAVRRTSLRALPTGEGLFYYAGDHDFDALQETELDPGEAVVVLHQSSNKFFYYVQAKNYSGWVSGYNLAFTDKKTWQQYVDPAKFLVVLNANLNIKTAGEQVLYQQGSRLPLAASGSNYYTVNAPIRQKDGSLKIEKINLAKSSAVHEGYLPYTSNNILRSAFKFYNMPYGWGGLKNSVDCSSLMYNAYRTVGIFLPRNADEQEMSAGTKYPLSAVAGNNVATISKLLPGAGLYMDGHVVMYIGKINNVPYCIHSLGSYFAKGQVQRVMKVVVSDLSLTRGNGKTFLDNLNTAVEFR